LEYTSYRIFLMQYMQVALTRK